MKNSNLLSLHDRRLFRFGLAVLMAILAPSRAAIVDEGEGFTVYQSTRTVFDVNGSPVLKTNRFTLLENALNYFENGVWKRSEDVIESFPAGAVARKGPNKAIFSHSLNASSVFDIQASDGLRLRGGVRSIQLTDVNTDKSVVLAKVRANAVGEILPPNQVLYRDAFEGTVRADCLLIWRHQYFCQDIILRTKPILPLEMDPETTRLEVITEFIDAPEANLRTARNADFLDHAFIEFGRLTIIPGKAFAVDEGAGYNLGAWNPEAEGTLVRKEWHPLADGRTFLIEWVPWKSALPGLNRLALAQAETRAESQIASARQWPSETSSDHKAKPLQIASAPYQPTGYVLDYIIIPTQQSPSTFQANTTYYITSQYSPGTFLTFGQGCVIKFKENAYLMTYNGFSFPSTGNKPVFTSRNDDLFGQPIQGTGLPGETDSDGDPTKHRAYSQLWSYYPTVDTVVDNARFRWAKQAIIYDSDTGDSTSHSIENSHFEHSDTAAFIASTASVAFVNVTACGTPAGLSGTAGSESIEFDCGTVNATSRSGTEAEVSIAVNPLNPLRVVAFSVYLNPHPEGLIRSRSNDGGVTWTVDQIATGGDYPQACCDPSAAFDQYGNLFLTYMNGNKNTVILLRSTDQGNTFTSTPIFSYQGPAAAYPYSAVDQPTVTTGPGQQGVNGSVWITFAEWRAATDKYKIRVAGAPVTSQGVGSFTLFPDLTGTLDTVFSDITVGPNGQVICAYQDKSTQKLYSNLDSDGLGSGGFGAAREVVATKMAFSLKIPAQNERGVEISTGVAYDRSQGPYRGRAYFLYTDRPTLTDHNTDIYVKHSTDNGATWSSSVKVNNDTTTTSQFIPWMAVDQSSGKIAVSWYDCRHDTTANRRPVFYAAVSVNGAQSFPRNIRINPTASDLQIIWNNDSSYRFDYGDYTGLAYVGGYLYPAWADNSNNPLNTNGQLKLEVHAARFPF